MWEVEFFDMLNEHFNEIDYVNKGTYTIIMENSENYTNYKGSDLILTYSPQGELVVKAERIMRSKFTFFSWLKLKRIIKSEVSVGVNETIDKVVRTHKKYIDVIEFKRWWLEWAKEL